MKVTIIGAGAYACALATVLNHNKHDVTLWTPFEEEKELLKIKGIGKTKVEKYGKDIIAIIDQFTAENQLEGFVAQKMFFNQEKKNKK